MLLVGVGCGENVLVGNLQLRSLSDAGADIAEAIEADGGSTLPFRKAEGARRARIKDKSEKDGDNSHSEDKGHNN
jgi:hypothetical protein